MTQPYFSRVGTVDLPQTAACMAAQVAGLVSAAGGPGSVIMHKFGQTVNPRQPSLLTKNGV
jgi:hypothetical protein